MPGLVSDTYGDIQLSDFDGFPQHSINGQIVGSNMFSQSLSEPFIVREIRRWVKAQRLPTSSHFRYDVYLREQNDGFTVECSVKIQSGVQQWSSRKHGPGAHAAVRLAIQGLQLF